MRYKLDIRYKQNELQMNIVLLDDVIMSRTYIVDKHGASYYCFGDFIPESFDKLIEAMENGNTYEAIFLNRPHSHESICYDTNTEILSFITKFEQNINKVDINMFNRANINEFISEFEKINKFISCLKDNSDE
jgi:hypothetical protein